MPGADSHLRPLTLVVLLIFLAVLMLAFMPQRSELGEARLRLGIVAVSVGALGLGLWAIRRANRRVARAARTAMAIAEGDYSTRLEIDGSDSVSSLSAALNRLAQRGETALGDLDARELQVHQLTTHDLLTGLANRRLFFELMSKEIAHARRAGQAIGVGLFDLDRFKDFNESLGTAWGDKILQKLARRLQAVTREADTVARIGSDEFGLIVTRAQRLEDVVEAVQRVFTCFDEPVRVGGKDLRVPASGGISVFPDDGSEPETLLRRADSAVTWSKTRGGKTCRRFESFMERSDDDRVEIEQDFPEALRSGQLSIKYQPQVVVSDGRIAGMEALVRWQHPVRGRLTAGAFIPLLERTSLMPVLGDWLLNEICRQGRVWQRSGRFGVPISVNVSVRQFEAGNLSESVGRAIDKHQLEPELLQLEITESIAMHDIEQISQELAVLTGLGIKIQLDDFGTGYSSLGYLLRFPVDVLKIDRTFISGLPDGTHSQAIVRATIALASSLGLSVIAEGVETVEQFDFLRKADCEVVQGYLFGRPLVVERMEAVLRQGRLDLPCPSKALRSRHRASGL